MTQDLAPFVRTDFSDEAAWQALLAAVVKENDMGFRAYVRPISDKRYEQAKPGDVVAGFDQAAVVFVADQRAMSEQLILCLDTEVAGASFRVRPEDLWIVENNVSIGNLLFEELLDQVDDDGVLIGMEG